MCNSKVKLIEIDGDKAHVVGSGALIVDGYADPYKVDNFEFDIGFQLSYQKKIGLSMRNKF